VDVLAVMSSAGQYTLRLRSDLQAGAAAGAAAAAYFDDVQITVEGTANAAPAVQVLAPNGGETWYGTKTVQWRGADADGNVVTYKIYISTNAGATWAGPVATVYYQESATPATHTYNLDTTAYVDSDNASVKVAATDGLVEVEDASDAFFSILNTVRAPTLVSPQNATTISNVTPTLDWTDVAPPAGLKNYTVQVSYNIGFTSIAYTTNATVSQTTSDTLADGTYYWRVKTTDSQDGESGWSDTWSFVVYTYAPTVTTVSVNVGAAYTTTRSVSVSASAVYSLFVSYSTDGSVWTNWEQYSGAVTKTLQLPEGDGAKAVYVRTKDAVGHMSQSVSDAIVLDTVAPATVPTTTGDMGEEGQYKGSAVVNFTATDTTSGVEYVFYKVDGGEWATGTTAVIMGDGTHTVDYFALDRAGNKEQAKQLVVKVYTPISPVPYVLLMCIIIVSVAAAYVWKRHGFAAVMSRLTRRRLRDKFYQQFPQEVEGVKLRDVKIAEAEGARKEEKVEKKEEAKERGGARAPRVKKGFLERWREKSAKARVKKEKREQEEKAKKEAEKRAKEAQKQRERARKERDKKMREEAKAIEKEEKEKKGAEKKAREEQERKLKEETKRKEREGKKKVPRKPKKRAHGGWLRFFKGGERKKGL
jgi:hypothetical protein